MSDDDQKTINDAIRQALELVLGVDCSNAEVREAIRKDMEFARRCRVYFENRLLGALDAVLGGVLKIAIYSLIGAGVFMVGSKTIDPSNIRTISAVVTPASR